MAEDFIYPTSRTLREINAEKVPNLQRVRPTFALFPDEDDDAWRIEWQQRDNYRGFQQLRGLNGQPSYVRMWGRRWFSAEPGVFGEYMFIDERMMTQRARDARDRGPVNITDLITERQDYLNLRETDLKEWIHWAILLNGTMTIAGPTGAEMRATFPITTVTMSDWSNRATATPIADLMGLKSLTLGKSLAFDQRAIARGNSTTISHALLNTNPADMGGMRVSTTAIRTGGPINLDEANRILVAQGVPTLEMYDEGYNEEVTGAFTLWIPNDVLSIVGQRTDGSALGAYRHVRNVNNANAAPGRYTKVIDTRDREVPRRISVHQGHNGGPVLYFPSAIVRANV